MACRQRAAIDRRKAAGQDANQRPEQPGQPEPPEQPETVAIFSRPMRAEGHPDDPERAAFLRPPATGIPAVDSAAG